MDSFFARRFERDEVCCTRVHSLHPVLIRATSIHFEGDDLVSNKGAASTWPSEEHEIHIP